MSNVLSDDKKQQVIALGRLGWSLRRIEAAVHIRRETVAGYLRAVGIPVRPPGGWGRRDTGKTGQRGDYRLWRGIAADNGPRTASLIAVVRPASALATAELIELGTLAWPQCHGDLAGLGR